MRTVIRPGALAQRFVVLAIYGVLFTLLRYTAASWSTHKLFSVWFPAAGLRFAFLWIVGRRWTVPVALAELIVSVGAGTVALSSNLPLSLLGIVGPCLVYGVVISEGRARVERSPVAGQVEPLAFGVSAILGSMAACIAALPWAIPLALQRGSIDAPVLFSSLLVFSLGDLLGILILAPPLIWIADRVRLGFNVRLPSRGTVLPHLHLALLLACGWGLVWVLQRLGDGLVLAPVLLAACWCGLRGGRVAAWAAIVTTAAIVLPVTEQAVSDAIRVQVHMQLACVAVGAYLAGSYVDAQQRAVVEIERRDRLLLRAERLKTLRAMSVAVIHEISQPLSTIAIEARAMVEAAATSEAEVSEMASLISRKAEDLSDLIRRLRAFGSGGNESRAPYGITKLVDEVISLATPEAKRIGVSLQSLGGPDLVASINDVEIRQALLNLIRNAIAAAPKSEKAVAVGWSGAGGSAQIWVENKTAGGRRSEGGMGLGLIIARTIAQAHGGNISIAATSDRVRSILELPIDEGVES